MDLGKVALAWLDNNVVHIGEPAAFGFGIIIYLPPLLSSLSAQVVLSKEVRGYGHLFGYARATAVRMDAMTLAVPIPILGTFA